MSTVTFLSPLGQDGGMQPFPARIGQARAAMGAAAFAQDRRLSRRLAVELALLPDATVDGKPAQIRAIECLRAGLQHDESGIRRNITRLDLLRMVAEFDAQGRATPLHVGVATAQSIAGVVLGLLLFDDRLFVVAAIGDALALEIEAGSWRYALAELTTVADNDAASGIHHELAGVALRREAVTGADSLHPLALASPIQRAEQRVGQYESEQNITLSVGLDMAAAGMDFLPAARAMSNALTEWRNA